mmetsp:Transcript_12235/g.19384  ORF Transcript_12235/g.19384 Transcript_12235/m.19384 type:complete len:115 (-) Transcript_12235:660-1004(-)
MLRLSGEWGSRRSQRWEDRGGGFAAGDAFGSSRNLTVVYYDWIHGQEHHPRKHHAGHLYTMHAAAVFLLAQPMQAVHAFQGKAEGHKEARVYLHYDQCQKGRPGDLQARESVAL